MCQSIGVYSIIYIECFRKKKNFSPNISATKKYNYRDKMSIRNRIILNKKNSISWHWQKRSQCPNFSRSQSYHGAQERPLLNPEKETETPGFFFEILTLREFLRNPSILPFIQTGTYSIPMAHPRKSALFTGSNELVGVWTG